MNRDEPPIVGRRDWPARTHGDDVREELDRQVGTTGVTGRYDLDPGMLSGGAASGIREDAAQESRRGEAGRHESPRDPSGDWGSGARMPSRASGDDLGPADADPEGLSTGALGRGEDLVTRASTHGRADDPGSGA